MAPFSNARANLRRRVGTRVKRYQSAQRKELWDLAKELYDKLALSELGAMSFLSCVRQGHHPNYSNDLGRGVPFSRLESSRLSKVLEHIGVDSSDPLIEHLRREIRDFEYPFRGEIPVDGRNRRYGSGKTSRKREPDYSI